MQSLLLWDRPENRQYKRIAIKNSEPMWVDSFRVQKVFCKSQARCIIDVEERVENLERKNPTTEKLQAKVAGKAPDDGPLNRIARGATSGQN